MGALVLIPFLQMAGQSNLLIVAVLTMTVADIGLDLLNALVFHGGMFGMGLASSLSYYAAILVVGFYFLSKRCVFRFSLKQVSRQKSWTEPKRARLKRQRLRPKQVSRQKSRTEPT